jgi:hypothetical protein
LLSKGYQIAEAVFVSGLFSSGCAFRVGAKVLSDSHPKWLGRDRSAVFDGTNGGTSWWLPLPNPWLTPRIVKIGGQREGLPLSI